MVFQKIVIHQPASRYLKKEVTHLAISHIIFEQDKLIMIIILYRFQASIQVIVVIKQHLQPLNISLRGSHEIFCSFSFFNITSQLPNSLLSIPSKRQKTQEKLAFLEKEEKKKKLQKLCVEKSFKLLTVYHAQLIFIVTKEII